MRLPVVFAAAALLLAPQSARAQRAVADATPVSTARADAVSATEALAQMHEALRQLVILQERYWMDHGTYTTDIAALGLYPPVGREGAWTQVIFAGGRGWTAMATHPAVRGKSCVVYVGHRDELPKLPATRGDRTVPTEEGQPACDAP